MNTLRLVAFLSNFASAIFAAQIVEGHVVNSVTGTDISGARVTLTQNGDMAYTATTGPQGRFRIDNVVDGNYDMATRADGFSRMPGVVTFQAVTGGAPMQFEIKMIPRPKISGHVLDPDGNQVPNADLWILTTQMNCESPACYVAVTKLKTSEKGEYHADLDIVPDKWLLSATAPTGMAAPGTHDKQPSGWVQTFYPNATDPQLSAKVLSTPGSDLWNMDIKLAAAPVHRIRGRILDPRGDPVPKASVLLGTGFGPSLHQDSDSDGAFDFTVAGEGERRISARLDRGDVKLWAAQTLQIKDRDLDNVELRLASPFSLPGVVVTEVPDGVHAPALPRLPDIVMEDAGGARLEDAPRMSIGVDDGKGGMTFKELYPGPHRVVVLDPFPGIYYLDSVRLGDIDALASEVSFQSGAQPLTLTYKLDGGTVRGSVEACGAGRVMLLPTDLTLGGNFFRGTACGLNGQFDFANVRPGEYYGIAVADDSSDRWNNAIRDIGFLNRHATKVAVRPHEITSPEIRLTRW